MTYPGSKWLVYQLGWVAWPIFIIEHGIIFYAVSLSLWDDVWPSNTIIIGKINISKAITDGFM